MASGGLKKKRSGRKANNNRKMMQDFQQLSSNHYPDVEALKLALLVSEQEAEYGVNMYDSLQPEDEDIIADYMSQGYTLDEAVFEVFTSKVRSCACIVEVFVRKSLDTKRCSFGCCRWAT
jgi:hypothetical protein